MVEKLACKQISIIDLKSLSYDTIVKKYITGRKGLRVGQNKRSWHMAAIKVRFTNKHKIIWQLFLWDLFYLFQAVLFEKKVE
jgi:hypothetical protein